MTLLGVMVRYQITPNVSAQFNSDNLLDEKFFVLDEYDNTYYGTPVDHAISINGTWLSALSAGVSGSRLVAGNKPSSALF